MPTKLTSRIPWRTKLEKPGVHLPKIVRVPPKWRKQYGSGTMLIAHPLEVDALIRKVPRGKLVTVAQLRKRLARTHRTDTTCPLTTGIFVRIVAEVAEEDRRARKKRVTPYWRVVRDDGGLNEKFPGGVKQQARRLRAEGFLLDGGKRVRNFDRRLVRL